MVLDLVPIEKSKQVSGIKSKMTLEASKCHKYKIEADHSRQQEEFAEADLIWVPSLLKKYFLLL